MNRQVSPPAAAGRPPRLTVGLERLARTRRGLVAAGGAGGGRRDRLRSRQRAPAQPPRSGSSGPDLQLARFDHDLEPLLPGTVTLPGGPGASAASDPRLVRDGDAFLAAWTQLRADGESDVRGARIEPDAVDLRVTPFEIAVGPEAQRSASFVTTGSELWAIWVEEAERSRIVAGRIEGGASPRVVDRVAVSPEGEDARHPAAAADSRGRILVAYERFDHTPGVLNWRVVARPLPDRPQGAACWSREECASHNCVDGVCCNQPCTGGLTDCLACSVAAGAPEDGRCAAVTDGTACGDGGGADDAGCASAEACSGGLCLCGGGSAGAGGGLAGGGGVGAGSGGDGELDGVADTGGCGCGGPGAAGGGAVLLAWIALLGSRRRRYP